MTSKNVSAGGRPADCNQVRNRASGRRPGGLDAKALFVCLPPLFESITQSIALCTPEASICTPKCRRRRLRSRNPTCGTAGAVMSPIALIYKSMRENKPKGAAITLSKWMQYVCEPTLVTSHLTGPKSGLLSRKSDSILLEIFRLGDANGSSRAMAGIICSKMKVK